MHLQQIRLYLYPLPPPKPPKCDLLSQIRKKLKTARSTYSAPATIKKLCKESRKLSRLRIKSLQLKSNMTFNSLVSKDPSRAFKAIRYSKNSKIKNINTLSVGQVTYKGKCVKDGFYDSLSALKNPPTAPSYGDYDLDYKLILWISSSQPIPLIPIQTTEKILYSLKKHVHDINNICPLHFINAGHAGIKIFHTLLTSLIVFINLSTIDTLNQVLSILLHKGHGKDPCSDRSYRTISNCTVLAKALDAYIGSLNIPIWDKSQIDLQFQAKNSSHDLASLQVTELIGYSNNVLNRPLYALFLDAKSCFDRVCAQNVIKNAYRTGISDQSLNIINNRLTNRSSYIKFNTDVIGPINDTQGVEQGGLLSDRLFRLVGNDQLLIAQISELGVPLQYPKHPFST